MTQEEFKRKLAAILSADVKEYSRLMRENEAETIRTLSEYREVIATLTKQHHGRVVDTVGDNLLAEFASVVDAVQGAVAIQKELKVRNEKIKEDRRMLFRIGINLGDLVVEGDRIYGDGVNIAARLEAMADPGGICISRTAYDQIEDKLPLGYEYLGEKTVKNIVKPVRAYKVIMEPEENGQNINKAEHEKSRKKLTKVKKQRERSQIALTERGEDHENNIEQAENSIKETGNKLLRRHLGTYAGVIGFLLIVNMLTWGGSFWVIWPALGWGLFLFLHWVKIFNT